VRSAQQLDQGFVGVDDTPIPNDRRRERRSVQPVDGHGCPANLEAAVCALADVAPSVT
jgi:hypothetical protein